ncbi:hypothetical protein JCM30566_01770 [Marinitoga arctica]
MSRELNHMSDIMFELSGDSIEALLEDLCDSFNRIFDPVVGGLEREYVYNIKEKELDDILFDIGNYMLNKINEGLFPAKVENVRDKIKIYFSNIYELNSDIELKAVAYPKVLQNDNIIKVHVIFDI